VKRFGIEASSASRTLEKWRSLPAVPMTTALRPIASMRSTPWGIEIDCTVPFSAQRSACSALLRGAFGAPQVAPLP
jgi:hypothetical protein